MSEWKPIDTAPRDKEILIFVQNDYGGNIFMARWDKDESAIRPKPRWTSSSPAYKAITAINGPPTHWMPLPPPPTTESK
jgi:hypothetical protein